ncbi:MAG: UpxY family transcription antiterminator [Paludibacteraceae bacterium]|nr:UpxY family transcription antiterminator [Paludibacteraceae bacterium]MBR5373968.1 UpxY family transcription antiterminator [Paludibacteraceae bacterium]
MSNTREFGWFAVNVFFNRVTRMSTLLDEDKVQHYVPMRTVELFKDGQKIYQQKQLVTSLLFLKCDKTYLARLKDNFGDAFYVYSDVETKQPRVIPDKEMDSFILVTSVRDMGLELLPKDTVECKIGDHVRVIDGVFKGAEGYVKRIQGRKRLIVSIEGIAVVATSYIPRSFLEKIED